MDGLTLNQNRLEGLDRETVQRRGAVKKNQTILDDLVEDVPHNRGRAIDGALGTLDVLNTTKLDQAAHDERLKELERHLLR